MKNGKWTERLLTLPTLSWLVVLFVIPTVLVLTYSFRASDPYGTIQPGWTLDSWISLGNPDYPEIIWRTLWLSAVATLICIGLGIPVAYYIARAPTSRRNWMLLLVILPFWTNFLIRIFAWRSLLHPEGYLSQFLAWTGFIEPGAQLLYNTGSILLVLCYTYLPFAILPIYAAAERFDFNLLDAAMDLGATRLRAFLVVFVPGVSRGLAAAFMIVFIPALGSYAIPDLVGGPTTEMIGNKIAQRVVDDRNLPHGAALSSLLIAGLMLPLILHFVMNARQSSARRNKGKESL